MASIDYFNGRKVESVEANERGWQINLEGNGVIYTNDDSEPVQALVGLALQRVVMSSEATMLYFGTKEAPSSTVVRLNPMDYAISDQLYTDDQVVQPQMAAPGIVVSVETTEETDGTPAA